MSNDLTIETLQEENKKLRNALQKCLPLVNKTTRVYVDNPSGGMRTVRMPNKLYVEIQKALASCEYRDNEK